MKNRQSYLLNMSTVYFKLKRVEVQRFHIVAI